MALDVVSIVVPNKLLSYSLLGNLGSNLHLSQFVETLTFNKDIIENPMIILSQPQDFASHINHNNDKMHHTQEGRFLGRESVLKTLVPREEKEEQY
ncbi:hypothetical protein O181_056414 [Austropuccinia psidii MF-1]|uniref:Uncharacterized protein n=1 Tax=Austropuccinia psidii MF-1 TaxID=1389203 RepID=A0A9Q3HVM3_9BASI|nr:hypothetical protein [Austropuccinia psidii MF-1]